MSEADPISAAIKAMFAAEHERLTAAFHELAAHVGFQFSEEAEANAHELAALRSEIANLRGELKQQSGAPAARKLAPSVRRLR
jgi:hypothetical protein